MGEEAIDETRFGRMPDQEFLDHPVRLAEKCSCARDEGSIGERREYRTVKLWRLDMQGDASWKRPIAASQPFPYLRHFVDQIAIGCHGVEL